MNFRRLQVFLKVCEYGSMTEAARRLHLTQPAVSQAILDLEDELKVKLFDRIKNKLLLTYPGEILLANGKKILHLVEETELVIEEISSLKRGKLRVGASMTIGTYMLPDLLSAFSTMNENIELSLVIDNTDVIADKILNNDIDVGLVEGQVVSADIVSIPYFDDELLLVCSPGHPWAEKEYLEAANLQIDDLIVREEGSGTRRSIINTLLTNKIPFTVKHELNNFEAIKYAVMANIGVSIMSRLAMTKELQEGKLKELKVLDIKLERKFNFNYHKDKYHSTLFTQFINFIQAELAKGGANRCQRF